MIVSIHNLKGIILLIIDVLIYYKEYYFISILNLYINTLIFNLYFKV